MSRAFQALLGMQCVLAGMAALSVVTPWMGIGPAPRPRETIVGVLLVRVLGGTAVLAWRLHSAGRTGWGLGVLVTTWLAALGALLIAAATARWN